MWASERVLPNLARGLLSACARADERCFQQVSIIPSPSTSSGSRLLGILGCVRAPQRNLMCVHDSFDGRGAANKKKRDGHERADGWLANWFPPERERTGGRRQERKVTVTELEPIIGGRERASELVLQCIQKRSDPVHSWWWLWWKFGQVWNFWWNYVVWRVFPSERVDGRRKPEHPKIVRTSRVGW